jgi:hypothetical protein
MGARYMEISKLAVLERWITAVFQPRMALMESAGNCGPGPIEFCMFGNAL